MLIYKATLQYSKTPFFLILLMLSKKTYISTYDTILGVIFFWKLPDL